MNLQALKSQKVSESGYTKIVNELRKKGDMTLTEITRAGINFLSKDLSKGFQFFENRIQNFYIDMFLLKIFGSDIGRNFGTNSDQGT